MIHLSHYSKRTAQESTYNFEDNCYILLKLVLLKQTSVIDPMYPLAKPSWCGSQTFMVRVVMVFHT